MNLARIISSPILQFRRSLTQLPVGWHILQLNVKLQFKSVAVFGSHLWVVLTTYPSTSEAYRQISIDDRLVCEQKAEVEVADLDPRLPDSEYMLEAFDLFRVHCVLMVIRPVDETVVQSHRIVECDRTSSSVFFSAV